MLDELASQDLEDQNVVKGFAPPRIRSLAKMADEIADEHGIAQPTIGDELLLPPPIQNPLTQLAEILAGLTYGRMMQVAQELRATTNADFTTAEGVAALLHKWANNTITPQPVVPQAAPIPTPTPMPTNDLPMSEPASAA